MVHPARDPRDELYEAYQRVPEHQHAEIVNGTLYVMPLLAPRLSSAASVLAAELGQPFRRGRGGPGGWWIIKKPELQLLAKEPVVPDLVGWRVERMPQLPDTAWFTLVPDWVCEVLSRSTEKLDRDEKPLITPSTACPTCGCSIRSTSTSRCTPSMRRPGAGAVRIHQGDTTVRAAPFDAIELDLAALWSPPRPA